MIFFIYPSYGSIKKISFYMLFNFFLSFIKVKVYVIMYNNANIKLNFMFI